MEPLVALRRNVSHAFSWIFDTDQWSDTVIKVMARSWQVTRNLACT